jgi:hypothetical protein
MSSHELEIGTHDHPHPVPMITRMHSQMDFPCLGCWNLLGPDLGCGGGGRFYGTRGGHYADYTTGLYNYMMFAHAQAAAATEFFVIDN